MLEIKRANTEDSQLIRDILSVLHMPEQRWSEHKIKEKIESGRREFYLLGDNGAIELEFGDVECELVAIAVNPRKKRHGSALLNFAENLAKERGCDKIWCYTLDVNDAQGFYENQGWSEEEILPKFFNEHTCFKYSKNLQ